MIEPRMCGVASNSGIADMPRTTMVFFDIIDASSSTNSFFSELQYAIKETAISTIIAIALPGSFAGAGLLATLTAAIVIGFCVFLTGLFAILLMFSRSSWACIFIFFCGVFAAYCTVGGGEYIAGHTVAGLHGHGFIRILYRRVIFAQVKITYGNIA